MAYTYVWPSTLPQAPQRGFGESYGLNIIRTPTDAGPAKQRFRGNTPNNLQLTFIMTKAQIAALETFIYTSLKGVARFGFTHPRTGSVVECRIVPQSGGDLYTMKHIGLEYYDINITFEVMP